MAGRLVGEVMNAAPTLRAAGVSRTAVLAAIVIAEECREPSRMGRVGRDRVVDVLGCTPRSATRLMDELREHRVVTLVEPGRRGRVSLYRLEALPGSDSVSAATPYHADSVSAETPSAGAADADSVTSEPESVTPETGFGVSRDPLPVAVGTGGSRAGAHETRGDEPPPARCRRHVDNPTSDPCRACGDAKQQREQWFAKATARRREDRLGCRWCGDSDWLEEPNTGLPIVKCDHQTDPARQVADARARRVAS